MPDATAAWVPIVVAAFAGGGFSTVVSIIRDLWTDAAGKRRSEVDRMAALLSEADAARKVAERRERIATEWGHFNRVAAIRAGVPPSELHELDFRDG